MIFTEKLKSRGVVILGYKSFVTIILPFKLEGSFECFLLRYKIRENNFEKGSTIIRSFP